MMMMVKEKKKTNSTTEKKTTQRRSASAGRTAAGKNSPNVSNQFHHQSTIQKKRKMRKMSRSGKKSRSWERRGRATFTWIQAVMRWRK